MRTPEEIADQRGFFDGLLGRDSSRTGYVPVLAGAYQAGYDRATRRFGIERRFEGGRWTTRWEGD